MINTIFYELIMLCLVLISPGPKGTEFELLTKNNELINIVYRGTEKSGTVTMSTNKQAIQFSIQKRGKFTYMVTIDGNKPFDIDLEQYAMQLKMGGKKENREFKDSEGKKIFLRYGKDNAYLSSPSNKLLFIIKKKLLK